MKKYFTLVLVLLFVLCLTGCGKSNRMVCVQEKDVDSAHITGKIIADLDGEEVTDVRVEFEAAIKESYYSQITDDTVMEAFKTYVENVVISYFEKANPTTKSRVERNKVIVNANLQIPEGYSTWGKKSDFKKGYTDWTCTEE